MAQVTNGKIVSLDEQRARTRLSRKESADTLASCRELALERMGAALVGMLDRVEDDLFELAGKSRDRDIQNTYLDARTQARANRAAIEATFRRHFVDFFDRKVQGDAGRDPPDPTHDQLSLVNEEDLEESIAVREMSKKLEAACEGELGALSQRMGFLLDKPELLDEANPVSPHTICAALKDACDQIGAGFKVRMALLRQFERHAEAELQRVYHDLNTHLVARSVLPEVRPGHRRGVVSQAPGRPDARPAQPDATSAKPAAAAAKTDVFSLLAQLVTPQAPGSDAAAGASGAAIAQSFVAELTRMHREMAPAASAAGASLVNVVRRIKSAPQSASLGTVDAMTIDIVAMLFDYIFEDPHIPSSVKALLGRLQIPTLKVALLDKAFFSSKAHPARRMLDLLAESALALDDSAHREAPTLALIESVVANVLADFESDVTLFEKQAARVAAFIEEQKRADNEIVERSARLIEEREREEIARVVAAEEVERRLEAHARVPAPVAQMLRQTWTAVLARTYRVEGESSSVWTAQLATAEDLLWSVEPKAHPEDRKRLVTMLPSMLKSLQDGMARIETPEERRNAFLGALVDCHAMAVKAGLRGLVPLAEVKKPKRAPLPAPEIERAIVPAAGIHVEEIRLRGPRPVANVFTRTGIWTNLQRGTWVDFQRSDGQSLRARLTWISPNKGVYLFTNASSSSAVSISPEALAEQMRLGAARIIDDAPLVARAVDSMLANLRRSRGAQG